MLNVEDSEVKHFSVSIPGIPELTLLSGKKKLAQPTCTSLPEFDFLDRPKIRIYQNTGNKWDMDSNAIDSDPPHWFIHDLHLWPPLPYSVEVLGWCQAEHCVRIWWVQP